MELRPYQQDALARIDAARERGVTRQLGVAATGLGKTIMFCALARRLGCRTLILAHRDELIAQAAAKVSEVWPEADVGVIKAERNEATAQVVVASVQTLGRKARLAKLTDTWTGDGLLGAAEPFGLVVVDEAHHATADSYQRIIGALDAGAPGGPLLLGVTATPDRGDGKGLVGTFDEVVFAYDVLWGIRAGYLADLRGLAVRLDKLNLGSVKVSRGDYDQGHAGALMDEAGAPHLIAAAWLEHALGRRTLVFTPTVAMAVKTADAFTRAGVRAGWVSGDTPLEDRRATLRAFSAGTLDVLVNCAVLTEGYDEPRVDCVVVARPTKSRALYVQMVGRGTRRHPDKTDCLVMDVVGAAAEHSLVTVPSLFGVGEKEWAGRLRDGSGSVTAVLDDRDRALIAAGQLRAEDVELFHKVRAEGGIAWAAVHAGNQPKHYTRSLGDRSTVSFRETPDGTWQAVVETRPKDAPPDLRTLVAGVSMEHAQGVAEDHVRANADARIVNVDAPWRKRPPTKKQLDAARTWRMTVDPAWNAGQLSEALDAHIARIHARRRSRAGS